MNILVIEAGKSERAYWSDLWRYRELFFFLSWRDILVRYKQTAIGILWAVIRPLLTMLVFTFIGMLANIPAGGIPRPVLVFTGLLPWLFFSTSLSEASNSLISSSNMLSKIYFPRIIVPASSVIVSFVDFLISLVILGALMAWFRVIPNWHLFFLPLFTLLVFFASMGLGLWLSALNVKYRDFRYVIPFIVQFGTYLSPVWFNSDAVGHKYGPLAYHIFCLNPMVGIINGFRWSIIGDTAGPLDWTSVLISFAIIFVVTISGLRYFRATEDTFADII